MKRLFNIFYTYPCKFSLIVLLIVCSWLMNSEVVDVMRLYKQDSTAVTNVLLQRESYDYKTSYFLKSEIKTAVADVLEYSLVYHRNDYKNPDMSAEEAKLKELYRRSIDKDYANIAEHLESLINFRFAVVNHKTDRVVSNMATLNGSGSDVTVRRYFGEDKNILIVRNANTPYFESGTMSDYVEFVSELANDYTDNFDLYVSFGNDFAFAGDGEEFSHRHAAALKSISLDVKHTSIYLLFLFLIFVIIVSVSGRRELGGKFYPALTDSLPNDLNAFLHVIVYISMSSLYENSIYLALRVTNTEDYWLSFSPEYYMVRSDISMVIMICIITSFSCLIKRQLGLGTLFSNTYISRLIKNFRNAEPDR